MTNLFLITVFLILAVSQPVFKSDTSVPRADQMTYTTGPLPAGGSFTGVDGVTIDASGADYEGGSTVFIERLEADELGVMAPNFGTPVTAFYRIGGTPEYHTQGGIPFSIHIPLPEGVETAGMGAIILAPVEGATHIYLPEGHPGVWIPSDASYRPDSQEAVIRLPLLRPEGIIIAIGEGVYRP